jgi:RNA polymerase sigma factor (sigma-70 family)
MNRVPDWTWWQEARAIAERQACGASDAADDLAQELALAALERGPGVARPGAWLERVGRNAEIDRWRALRRRRELAIELDAPAAPPDPEARVLARERRGLLRRALAALPRPLRRATLARFHADLSFDAVASRLGTAPVTARTRVHRALERLRARVGGLRALPVWVPGAQATVLSVALVAAVARPALVPTEGTFPLGARAVTLALHARRVAAAPPPREPAAAPATTSRVSPTVTPRAPAPSVVEPLATSAVRRYSYDDDEVTGELARPDGIVVVSRPEIKQRSLIELRWQFVPEVIKTLEDL